jgi:outer membrane protein assembly factor BamB
MLMLSEGKPAVVINGGDYVTGHDPATGAELWRAGGLNPQRNEWYRIIASTVVVGDLVFVPTREKPLQAFRIDGAQSKPSPMKLWETRWGPDVPTPVSDGERLWIVDDKGRFVCIDVKTGEPFYEPQRIEQGTYSPSLVLAAGRVYALSESGVCTVLAAGPEFKVLAVNRIEDEYTLSSPVVLDRQVLIRTSTDLFCIEEK